MDEKQQRAADAILGEFKKQVMMMLNETADEFDALKLNNKQRKVYNDFVGAFGQKVLALQIKLEAK